VVLYDNLENSNLPQDIFRQYSGSLAFRGLFRCRTSTGFRASHSYGHLLPDANYENLYHLAGCDPFKSFTFDFEFTSSSGFYE